MATALHDSWLETAPVTFEPAAAMCGLDFEPLETHIVELWVAEPWRNPELHDMRLERLEVEPAHGCCGLEGDRRGLQPGIVQGCGHVTAGRGSGVRVGLTAAFGVALRG